MKMVVVLIIISNGRLFQLMCIYDSIEVVWGTGCIQLGMLTSAICLVYASYLLQSAQVNVGHIEQLLSERCCSKNKLKRRG